LENAREVECGHGGRDDDDDELAKISAECRADA